MKTRDQLKAIAAPRLEAKPHPVVLYWQCGVGPAEGGDAALPGANLCEIRFEGTLRMGAYGMWHLERDNDTISFHENIISSIDVDNDRDFDDGQELWAISLKPLTGCASLDEWEDAPPAASPQG